MTRDNISTGSAHSAAIGVSNETGRHKDTATPTDGSGTTADPAALEAAAALGLPALAGMLVGTDDGLFVIDARNRFTYANPAACQMLGRPLASLVGQELLDAVVSQDHASLLARMPENPLEQSDPFLCTLLHPDGSERQIVCAILSIQVHGVVQRAATIRDLSGPKSAWRTAMALTQTAAQLVGTGTTEEILVDIARHGVEGTRALAVAIIVIGDDHRLVSAGGFGFPSKERSREAWVTRSITLDDLPGGDVLLRNEVSVMPDARSVWEQTPIMQGFAATVKDLDWDGVVNVPMSWENRVFGVFGVYLPRGLPEPSALELAFFTALANQAAVAITNARLSASAERSRLARDLHDSVSQALFSMTMHARAAQLSIVRDGLDENGTLANSVAQLAELTRGALAEMRALIFELRPRALAEEGLVAALRMQSAALSAREQVAVTVAGPERRLDLSPAIEEHLYRLTSEALHNVVKHAHATHASVSVAPLNGSLTVTVIDDGAGFDADATYAGHLGLTTMTERAEAIGADLRMTSAPGKGTTVTVTLPYGHSGVEGREGSGA
jgi:PAS domain S-box-containing protein